MIYYALFCRFLFDNAIFRCYIVVVKEKGGITMKVILAADRDGFDLKNKVKTHLLQIGYDITDLNETEGALDFVDSTVSLVKELRKDDTARGILFDRFAIGSYMVANKHRGIICAAVSDEHSAMMTIRHNSTRIITLGAAILGEELANACAEAYLKSDYDAGRHQVRIDMLNKLC